MSRGMGRRGSGVSGSLPGLSQSGRACQGGGREVCDKMLVASVSPRRPLPHSHSSPASFSTHPHPPPDPSPSTSSVSAGRGNPRDCGLKGSLSPPWGLAGVLNLLSPLSLKCSELWDQTAQAQTHLCFFLLDRPQDSVTLASEFLGGSGKFRCLQCPGEGQGGQVWNSVPFRVRSLTQPRPITRWRRREFDDDRSGFLFFFFALK